MKPSFAFGGESILNIPELEGQAPQFAAHEIETINVSAINRELYDVWIVHGLHLSTRVKLFRGQKAEEDSDGNIVTASRLHFLKDDKRRVDGTRLKLSAPAKFLLRVTQSRPEELCQLPPIGSDGAVNVEDAISNILSGVLAFDTELFCLRCGW